MSTFFSEVYVNHEEKFFFLLRFAHLFIPLQQFFDETKTN